MRRFTAAVLVSLAWGVPLGAQVQLTLADAMERARRQTPEARAAAAGEAEAEERTRQARGAYLPTLDVTTSAQRGDHPVFVFSSLLAQRRFTEANFAIAALNEPPAISNIRTYVGAQQSVWDGGQTRSSVALADIARREASTAASVARQDLALQAARAYLDVVGAEAQEAAAAAAVAAAAESVEGARRRREVGLVTAADVLAAEVYLAGATQSQIAARAETAVARLRLADATGLPAGTEIRVTRPEPAVAPLDVDTLVTDALRASPDLQAARLRVESANASVSAARSGFLPRVDLQAGAEFNGANLADQRSSWIAGAQVQLNLFRGFADQARLAAAAQGRVKAEAEAEARARDVETGVRAAAARLEAARASDARGRAALSQAREAHRIIRDRYDSGVATMSELLRAAGVTADAESRAIAAELEVIARTLALERAAGRL
jgi:outer membrane protein